MSWSFLSRRDDPPNLRRLGHIDGLRGLAIVAVVIFHAYARWPNLYPYGDRFAGYTFTNSKIAGVQLFFIISGFVILMTLQRSKNFYDFIFRRWIRLFPAMLICSMIILILAWFLPERPRGPIHFLDLLPGLTFSGRVGTTDPVWGYLTPLFGRTLKGVEGAFWSLYVEVRFYVVFGVAYFLLGGRAAIALILLLFGLGVICSKNLHVAAFGEHAVSIIDYVLYITGIRWLTVFLYAKEYGWFAAGSVFYIYHRSANMLVLCFGVAIGLVSLAATDNPRLATLVLALAFVAAMTGEWARQLLCNRVLLFFGFVSYPLYLVHENMMVALIVKIGLYARSAPDVLVPVVPIAVVTTIAWMVARYAEPAAKAFIKAPIRTVRRALLHPGDFEPKPPSCTHRSDHTQALRAAGPRHADLAADTDGQDRMVEPDDAH